MSDNTFGAPKNLLLAGVVLALIILLNRQRNPYLRVASLGDCDGGRICAGVVYGHVARKQRTDDARRLWCQRRSITVLALNGVCCCR